MDSLENSNSRTIENELIITDEIKGFLKQASIWGKILGIIGFFILGIFLVMIILFLIQMSSINESFPRMPFGMFKFYILMYVVVIVLQFFPTYFVYNFGTTMNLALKKNDQEQLRKGFFFLKNLFKWLGILILVSIVLYGFTIMLMLFRTTNSINAF